jgi:predicted AAA+ superfamily ATPase
MPGAAAGESNSSAPISNATPPSSDPLLKAAALGRSLGVDGKTIRHDLDLLSDLLLVRCLQPLHAKAGKCLVKSAKVNVRDSGLVHTLLGLDQEGAVLAHPQLLSDQWRGRNGSGDRLSQRATLGH